MRYIATRRLYEYWNSLRASSAQAPLRVLFNPMAIPSVLSRILLIDLSRENYGNIRVAGSQLYGLYGKEITGTNFTDLWQKSDHAKINKWLTDLSHQVITPLVDTKMTTSETAIETEFLLLPMRNERNEHFQAIGIQSFSSDKPWYGLKSQAKNEWIGQRRLIEEVDIRPADVFSPSVTSNIIELARRAKRPEGARRVGHLSVIDGGVETF